MAYAQPSPALPSPSHPMAKTGYGKRAVGDEVPHADPDFAHLSPRDAEIATFVDHLEDGHAMGYKAIAAAHPRYGQQAVRVSLGRISLAGHLRWIKEHGTGKNGCEIIDGNRESLAPQEEMDQDLLAIVHTFSCRLYGLRRYEKALKGELASGGGR